MEEQSYSDTADELVSRILKLIPDHPELITMDDPWKLFKVDGFNCNDLGPSLYQASWALSKAQQEWGK